MATSTDDRPAPGWTARLAPLAGYAAIGAALITFVGSTTVGYWNHSLAERRFVAETMAGAISKYSNAEEARKHLLMLLEAGVSDDEDEARKAVDKLGT